MSSFAGHECEYSAQEVCDYGTSNSLKSFCTNAGTCVKIIFKGEPHAACACPTEFEGVHCQYLVGTAPASELLLAMYQDTESVLRYYNTLQSYRYLRYVGNRLTFARYYKTDQMALD